MENANGENKEKLSRIIEQVCVVIGAVVCLAVGSVFSGYQAGELWPLPGAYFLELSLLAIMSAASRLVKATEGKDLWIALPWIAAGVLLPFVILGGFSIGPFLSPALLAFLLAGTLTDRRLGKDMSGHISLAVMAALVQAAVIIAMSYTCNV